MSGHRRPSQKQRVLALLQEAGARGVRTNEFLHERLPRFGARILELRNEGYWIGTTPDSTSASGSLYTLLGLPGNHSQPRVPRKPSAQDALREIATGLPTEDDWSSAASFMERVALIIDRQGVKRPAHYKDDGWEWR